MRRIRRQSAGRKEVTAAALQFWPLTGRWQAACTPVTRCERASWQPRKPYRRVQGAMAASTCTRLCVTHHTPKPMISQLVTDATWETVHASPTPDMCRSVCGRCAMWVTCLYVLASAHVLACQMWLDRVHDGKSACGRILVSHAQARDSHAICVYLRPLGQAQQELGVCCGGRVGPPVQLIEVDTPLLQPSTPHLQSNTTPD
jgi:hypothetical protein